MGPCIYAGTWEAGPEKHLVFGAIYALWQNILLIIIFNNKPPPHENTPEVCGAASMNYHRDDVRIKVVIAASKLKPNLICAGLLVGVLSGICTTDASERRPLNA
jgi:hypothetical protein